MLRQRARSPGGVAGARRRGSSAAGVRRRARRAGAAALPAGAHPRDAVPDRRRLLRPRAASCCARSRWRPGGSPGSCGGPASWSRPRPAPSSAGSSGPATGSRSRSDAAGHDLTGDGPAGRLVLVGTPDRQPRRPVAPGGRSPAPRPTSSLRGHPPHPAAAHRGRDPAPGRLLSCTATTRPALGRRLVAPDRERGERRGRASPTPGMPGISDPGERLVAAAAGGRACRSRSCPGRAPRWPPWWSSGLPTDRFVLRGVPAPEGSGSGPPGCERAGRAETRTIVLYEAPHRVAATLADLAAALRPRPRRVAVARELTKKFTRRSGGERWRGGRRRTGRRGPTVSGPSPGGSR